MKKVTNSPKTVSLFGNFGTGNLGNDCTLQAVIQNIRKYLPEAELDCICTGPENTSLTFGIKTVHMHPLFVKNELLKSTLLYKIVRKAFIGIPFELLRWINALKTLKKTNMLIFIGTQFLSDNLSGILGNPYLTFKWAVASKIMRCKLVFLSVGVGPLSRSLSRFFVKCALKLADYRSYRDVSSKNYLKNIGFHRLDDPICPDLAFSLHIPVDETRKKSNKDQLVISMGVLDYKGQFAPTKPKVPMDLIYKKYLNQLSLLLFTLIDNSHKVRFVIGDTACDPKVIKDLLDIINNQKNGLDYQKISNDQINSITDLIANLSMSDIVVSPRFHNIVLGLILNRPVVSISYHKKFDDLMMDCGLEEYILDINKFNKIELKEKIDHLLNNSEKAELKIYEKVNEYRDVLNKQYRILTEMI